MLPAYLGPDMIATDQRAATRPDAEGRSPLGRTRAVTGSLHCGDLLHESSARTRRALNDLDSVDRVSATASLEADPLLITCPLSRSPSVLRRQEGSFAE